MRSKVEKQERDHNLSTFASLPPLLRIRLTLGPYQTIETLLLRSQIEYASWFVMLGVLVYMLPYPFMKHYNSRTFQLKIFEMLFYCRTGPLISSSRNDLVDLKNIRVGKCSFTTEWLFGLKEGSLRRKSKEVINFGNLVEAILNSKILVDSALPLEL